MIYIGVDNYYDILAARGMLSNNIKEIYDCLNDKDYRVRSLAAQTIQVNYPTQKSFDVAVKMLSENKYYQREIGAYILGQLGTPNMPYAKESIPLLYKMFKDKSQQVVATAISSIGHLWEHTNISRDEEMISSIIEFTENRNPDIRICSIMALSSLKNEKRIVSLIEHIYKNEIDVEVKDWANVALEILLDD